ncbi:hypothetical protein SRABI111_05203 [Pseudomonas carnis]|uniref:Uncharacterized protein n=2 Tax=Pseudomonas TaxID=286 RepID=A0A120G5T1_PSEFL|nr:hypothetical protein PFLmoz3_05629 [Pseudomonas fluorescens]CAH0307380.1 hypothetical protein SRABI110_04910 [Pseudomonas carnis]CAH0316383.1 hypothetical protein SRABI111_05203 [Pseudomonas carnis]CAH0324814.1 hypothetical protein SRABI64_05773 [Pseudomonas carnis]SFY21914.1 hypothetical protein SAMN03159398_04776 [Pseudomonas sp. NFPP02]
MDSHCKKLWKIGVPCAPAQPLPPPMNAADVPASPPHAAPTSIVFGTEQAAGAMLIPGYNALAPHLRPVRDPALSLVALSGEDPTEPVMVEVPLVLNNTTFTATRALTGYRVGYVERYVQGNHVERVEHSEALHRVFDTLRRAGVQWVAVDMQRSGDNQQACREIDERVAGLRLDALVSEDPEAAFHNASRSGYPTVCETLEDGSRVWFYGARWAGDRLAALVRAYRQLRP